MASIELTASRTADFDRAKRELDEQGYCILPDILTKGEVASLKERLREQAEGETARGVATKDGGSGSHNQRVWMLVNKGRVFRNLMLSPVIDAVMAHLLGPDYLLSSLTANIAHRGGEPMALHTDQGYVGFWTPKPVVANIAWMLDDFTDANGGTRLVPGSHLRETATPDDGTSAFRHGAAPGAPSATDTIAAEGPAGSVLCFDGRLWHGTGANRTDQPRHALLSYHCRPFIRQQENFTLGLDPAVRESERPALLRRLGFNIWAGLGRVESPQARTPLFVSSGAVGELAPDGSLIKATT